MKKLRLVLRLSALGDVVLASAFVLKLREVYPEDDLVFLSSEAESRLVARSFPGQVHALSVKARRGGFIGFFLEGFRLGKRYRASKLVTLERLYDLHGVLKSRAYIAGLKLSLLLRGKWLPVSQYKKRTFERYLSVLLMKDILGPRHVFEDYQKLLVKELGESKNPLRPKLNTSSGIERQRRAILVAPEAKHWKKRWPEAKWIEFIEKILASHRSNTVTLVGHLSAMSHEALEYLLRRHPNGRIQNALGKTKTEELADVAAFHSITICGNTSWLHISEAVGTPVVSLAGPVVPGFGFSPWLRTSREISMDLKCRPCSRHGSGPCYRVGKNRHLCMQGISPDLVVKEVEEMLR